ncbi:hypothetical protein EDC01DRAFT_650554 [Geopyxis carbonaria]|nr:hypothetical protein EDC01DRAFT_650554 [Geopyxis carbonaria]
MSSPAPASLLTLPPELLYEISLWIVTSIAGCTCLFHHRSLLNLTLTSHHLHTHLDALSATILLTHRPRRIHRYPSICSLLRRGAVPHPPCACPVAASPLFYAIATHNLLGVEALLAAGADVHARSRGTHATPLYKATRVADVAIVRVLLAAGADVEAGASPRPMLRCCATCVCTSDLKPLEKAVRLWDLALVRTLVEGGASAVGRTWGRDAPMIFEASAEVLEILVRAGADLGVRDCRGVGIRESIGGMVTGGKQKLEVLERGGGAERRGK